MVSRYSTRLANSTHAARVVDSISRAGGANDPKLMKEFHRSVMAGTAVGAHLFGAFEDTTGEAIGTIAFYGPGKEIMGE